MAQKPSLPKGTRDFGPEQMFKRDYILSTIKGVFKKYGFLPLETPALENLSVLTGKYGDEGDQLLFRVLNSGDFLSKVNEDELKAGSKAISPKIAEKGLKYDLTVPFARYVVSNQNDIAFPFKRFQIQPVWRADRPQKGRYREFYQCDVDVIGSNSLINEAELLAIASEVFEELNFQDYQISLSSRKVLEGLAECCGMQNEFSKFCTILDKLDKVGEDKVMEELTSIGLSTDGGNLLKQALNIAGSSNQIIESIRRLFTNTQVGIAGVEEVESTLNYFKSLGFNDDKVIFDLSLARGLSYYTGVIYEVKPTSIQMGTITAGGRYDDLTGMFGLKDMSGVGISFGIDRIYDTLEELDLFPNTQASGTQILLTNFDQEAEAYGIKVLAQLRSAGIPCEIYPESAKLKKQLAYANKKNIPNVLMIGSREMESDMLTLKEMQTGNQQELTIQDLIRQFQA